MRTIVQTVLFMIFLAWATFYLIPFLEDVSVGYHADPHDCGKVNESKVCPHAQPSPYGFQHAQIWPQ